MCRGEPVAARTNSRGPSPDGVEGVGSVTLVGFLDEVGARFAGGEAVVFDDPLRGDATLRWTYADLRAETRQIAKALIAAGVERGDWVDRKSTRLNSSH